MLGEGFFNKEWGIHDKTGNSLREISQIVMRIEPHFHHWEIICKEHFIRENTCMIMNMEGAYMSIGT